MSESASLNKLNSKLQLFVITTSSGDKASVNVCVYFDLVSIARLRAVVSNKVNALMYIFFVNFTLFLCFSSFVVSFYMHVNELKYIETCESSRDLPFIRSSLHYQTVKIACVCVLVYEHIHNHMSIKQNFF